MNEIVHCEESHNCRDCGKLILKVQRPSGFELTNCLCNCDDTENLFLDIRNEMENFKPEVE